MVEMTLERQRVGPVEVTLVTQNFRPERFRVEVERDEEVGGFTVGYFDDEAAARVLFASVVRAVEVAVSGECEDVDWTGLPPGFLL